MQSHDTEQVHALARRVFTDPAWFLAFGLGSGLVPKAPGTAGTLVGVLLFYPLSGLAPLAYGAVVAGILVAAAFVCDRVAGQLGEDDPGGIVLDEMVGIWVALFMVPAGWYWIAAGFAVFRISDVLKPWPANLLDRRLKGGWGIMLDDVVAGMYTLILLQAANWLAVEALRNGSP